MSESGGRLLAIDWLRGFVMMLMAVDHASASFNAGRLAVDSMYPVEAFAAPAWEPGSPLPPLQFATRWITHLCAPTFLFLSGTSLALSTAGREARGDSALGIDRHLAVRGALLVLFEAAWLSLLPSAVAGRYMLVLQVLYAIGVSLLAMVVLRRLPTPLLAALAGLWLVVGEWITRSAVPIASSSPAPLEALLFAPGRIGGGFVAYPLLSWLAMMMLGWALGRHLVALRAAGRPFTSAARLLAWAGAAALALFGAVRAANGYGNLGLLREGGGLTQWLHVSKYPPSLAFAALELGLMAWLLAAALRLESAVGGAAGSRNPFTVLGRTALFFYLLHLPLLGVGAVALGMLGSRGLVHTWVAAAVVVAGLYPLCLAYGRYKAAHPRSWAQYV